MNISNEGFLIMESTANTFFQNNKIFNIKSLWEIRITPQSMEHLRKKKEKYDRPMQEIYIRYLCFLSSRKILEGLEFYQEYKTLVVNDIERKNGKNSIVKKMAQFYWFVWIIESTNSKNRIRVVVKKIHWKQYAELVSVIPSRNSKWYSYYWEEI